MKRIYFTITNDLTYDQRMIRICRSLSAHGYSIVLAGIKQPGSLPLKEEPFRQVRLPCLFSKGKLFYIEFNIRLFFYLLFSKMDAICAIDLDTILPCLFVARLKKVVRIYDAHELFTEMKEVLSRPSVKWIWGRVERWAIPRMPNGYTVSQSIVDEFRKRYGVSYGLIRNVPLLREDLGISGFGDFGIGGEVSLGEMRDANKPENRGFRDWGNAGLGDFGLGPGERYILYQGAVNEARGLEFLLPAMREVKCRLLICGEGNLMKECRALVVRYGLKDKVIFTGRIEPDPLQEITRNAYLGINLVEPYGLNALYSLANKFFDYIHAGIPQVTMDFPEYRRIQEEAPIGVLLGDLSEKKIAAAINNLLKNPVMYGMFQDNCRKARLQYNWQEEEKKLLRYYHKILS